MGQQHNGWVAALFVAYVAAVGAAVLVVPRVSLGVLPPGPWDFWWVFLVITPHAAAAALWLGVRAGRFTRSAVVVFWLAAMVFGAGLWVLGQYLYGYAK